MNLIIDPWIPTLLNDGKRDLLSLQQLFAEAHAIRDLSVKPHERIALMRLLLCITQAALNGPQDQEEWESCEPLIQSRVSEYLAKWHCAFELFGEGPRFLQLPKLQAGKESDEGNSATKLDLALATGNNSTIFDGAAGTERLLLRARAALNLLTFQCFSPGGRIGIAQWNGKETAGRGSSNHSPCVPSSMIHTLLIGDDLLQTLHLNLLTPTAIQDVPNAGWGKPIWEMPVTLAEDSAAVKNATMTYLGRLVPLSRAIRLNEEGGSIILGNGLDYPIFPVFREVTATVVQRKNELKLLPASPGRSFWRQLSAITTKRRAEADTTAGPLALVNRVQNQDATLWMGALVTDKAKIVDVIEASYSLPANLFTELGKMIYEAGVHHAEESESSLMQAVKNYAGELKVISPAYDRARHHFWTRVEQSVSALFDLARNPVPKDQIPNSQWGQAVQRAAFQAYEQTCARQTARQIQAYALGLREFSFKSKSTKPKPKTS